MKPLMMLIFTIALAAAVLGMRSYIADQKLLDKARDEARRDMLDAISALPHTFPFEVPSKGGAKCRQKSYLTFYASQICFLEFRRDARGTEVRLQVKYYAPHSRLRQVVFQSNETNFSFVHETGEVVAEVYGDGEIRRFGRGRDD